MLLALAFIGCGENPSEHDLIESQEVENSLLIPSSCARIPRSLDEAPVKCVYGRNKVFMNTNLLMLTDFILPSGTQNSNKDQFRVHIRVSDGRVFTSIPEQFTPPMRVIAHFEGILWEDVFAEGVIDPGNPSNKTFIDPYKGVPYLLRYVWGSLSTPPASWMNELYFPFDSIMLEVQPNVPLKPGAAILYTKIVPGFGKSSVDNQQPMTGGKKQP